jgi:hypothetical protein
MDQNEKYYYIAIDKQAKTIQLRQCGSCKAVDIQTLAKEYNISDREAEYRFQWFFNDQKDYIDYNTFYKKYNKFTVLEAKI